jgi:DNA polymerase-3 subunit gamma/tau
MSNALPLKYRPKEFDEVYGNDAAIKSVQSMLDRDLQDIPKAWLFTGESGCGKTTMVRIISKYLKCADMDYHEYNAANTNGVDTIREISMTAKLSPMGGSVKIVLLDECHMLTAQAQQACLKMLEDAPKKTFFFLATTNPEKMLPAVKTRCTTVNLKTLPSNVAYTLVNDIAKKEGVSDMSPEVLKAISKACGGSAREALKILDQVIDIEDDQSALDMIEKTISCENSTLDLCRALMDNAPWVTIAKIIDKIDMDPEAARRNVMGYFTRVLLGRGDKRSAMILECFAEKSYFDSGKSGLVLSCYAVFAESN